MCRALGAVSLAVAFAACGRIGFDPAAPGSSGAPTIQYDGVLPVYGVGVAMPALIPTVTGNPDQFDVSPALPPGLQLDPMTGTIDGTPTTPQPATSYTVTAHNSVGQGSTTIQLRTDDAYIVNNNGDLDDVTPGDDVCETATGNGQCTLRAAFTEVNADGGTRSVVLVLAQTIQLQGELPGVSQSIELIGVDTASVVIDGGANQLTFYNANNVQLTFAYLTIRNAMQINPAFRTGITLTGDHIHVTGCGGFVNVGGANSTIVLRDSTFDANTGNVVYATAAVTIERCTFANNLPPVTGVVYLVDGSGSVTNSTFVGTSGGGSAIVVDNAQMTFAHNTFASNTDTAQFKGGAFSTFSNSTTTWTNNLFVNNTGAAGTCAISGAYSSDGGNLVFPAEPACQFGAASDPPSADPQLGPLADNGGPTQTMALGASSAAIDAANNANCTPTDQRGVARPLGSACDIGAVEQQ